MAADPSESGRFDNLDFSDLGPAPSGIGPSSSQIDLPSPSATGMPSGSGFPSGMGLPSATGMSSGVGAVSDSAVNEAPPAGLADLDLDAATVAPQAKTRGGMSKRMRALGHANPYNVFLGIALAALLVACLGMLIQLAGYGFDVSASSARRAGWAAPSAVRSLEFDRTTLSRFA